MDRLKLTYLIESYSELECLSYKCKCNISLEESYDIILEMVNDLKYSLLDSIENYNTKKTSDEYNNMQRILTESFVKINKARREKNVDLIESSIDDMFIGFLNKRKEIVYSGDNKLEELVVSESQDIADGRIMQIRDEYISIIESEDFISHNLMESTVSNNTNFLNNVKKTFESKHVKIVERDKDIIKSAKKNVKKNIGDIELEVPGDNNISFDKLISKHDNFDKCFNNNEDYNKIKASIKRFEDKSGNLKNGLENFYRSGNAKKEVSVKKVSGENAKQAIVNMIDYCEDFLSGKQTIIGKIDLLLDEMQSNSNKVEEGFVLESSSNFFHSLLEAKGKKDDNENKNDSAENLNKLIHDRQTGITTLMTIVEKRYFDYIKAINDIFSE